MESLKAVAAAVVAIVVVLLIVVVGIPGVLRSLSLGLPQSAPTVKLRLTQRPTSVADERAMAVQLSKLSAAKCVKPSGFWQYLVNEHGPRTVTVLVSHPSATDKFSVDCSTGKISDSFTAW